MKMLNVLLGLLLLLIGGGGLFYTLSMDVAPAETGDDEPSDPTVDYQRGPHNGRLLASREFELEVTIFESGVPPEFHIYPYRDGKPIPPDEVQLTVTLRRFGGVEDRITFIAQEDYLLGQQEVVEPHSFDVYVNSTLDGQTHTWEFPSYEGRTTMPEAAAIQSGIEFAMAGPGVVNESLELPGEIALDADRLVHITPRLSGVVSEVSNFLGDSVNQGEVLAVIDSRELADLKSAYLAAVERRDLAQSRFNIERDLHEKQISSKQEYLEARQLLAEAGIEVRRSLQKLQAIGISEEAIATARKDGAPFTRYELISPINGTVIEKHLAVGEAVRETSDCFVVADLSSVWVRTVVYAADLKRVRAGQRAIVRSGDLGATTEGTVAYIGDLVGQETRTAHAIIEIPNPDRSWRPGLYVTVELFDETALELPVVVPADAIQEFRDWSVVFLRDGELYEICPVELGRSFGDQVEITAGLKSGAQYVSKNSYLIKADIEKSGATHDH